MNVARIAPTWMTAVKAVIALSTTLSPSSCSVTVRCPVLDTGRNSVSPSTTPSTTAWTGFMRANLQRVRGNGATGGGGRAGRARLRPTPAGTPRTPHSRAGRRGATQSAPVSYTHLRAHETPEHLVCRLLLEKKKKKTKKNNKIL